MPLLPYDTLLIESPLPPDEALARLRGATEPARWLRFGPPPHAWEGEVTGDTVRIRRAISYQNGFLPRIQGRVEAAAQGSRLRATMTLPPFVTVFLAVWFGLALAAGVPLLIALFFGAPAGAAVIPAGMVLAGGALVSGAFTFEARIARARLAELLDGRASPGAGGARAARGRRPERPDPHPSTAKPGRPRSASPETEDVARMAQAPDAFTDTEEFPDDAEYAWWLNTHPDGYVVAVRTRSAPLLHRATCPEVDRDVHPGRLKAKGARQICSGAKSALRAWLARELPADGALLARCPKCGP